RASGPAGGSPEAAAAASWGRAGSRSARASPTTVKPSSTATTPRRTRNRTTRARMAARASTTSRSDRWERMWKRGLPSRSRVNTPSRKTVWKFGLSLRSDEHRWMTVTAPAPAARRYNGCPGKEVVVMARVFIHCTHGSENPTRAGLAWLMAKGLVESGHQPETIPAGDGAILAKKVVADSVLPVGLPPLKELIEFALQNRVRIHV